MPICRARIKAKIYELANKDSNLSALFLLLLCYIKHNKNNDLVTDIVIDNRGDWQILLYEKINAAVACQRATIIVNVILINGMMWEDNAFTYISAEYNNLYICTCIVTWKSVCRYLCCTHGEQVLQPWDLYCGYFTCWFFLLFRKSPLHYLLANLGGIDSIIMFFNEHGHVFGICCCTYRNCYYESH